VTITAKLSLPVNKVHNKEVCMKKRPILLYMTIGIAAGLILSACAGAATGQFGTGNGVLTGGPMVQFWQAPSGETASAEVLQVQAPLAAQRSLEMYRSAQAAQQIQTQPGHWCLGDDG
jgi:hypothetical protein